MTRENYLVAYTDFLSVPVEKRSDFFKDWQLDKLKGFVKFLENEYPTGDQTLLKVAVSSARKVEYRRQFQTDLPKGILGDPFLHNLDNLRLMYRTEREFESFKKGVQRIVADNEKKWTVPFLNHVNQLLQFNQETHRITCKKENCQVDASFDKATNFVNMLLENAKPLESTQPNKTTDLSQITLSERAIQSMMNAQKALQESLKIKEKDRANRGLPPQLATAFKPMKIEMPEINFSEMLISKSDTENPKNSEFTTARQVIAMHLIFEFLKVQNVDQAQKARFIEFLTGKNYKNIYDLVRSPFATKEKNFRRADLQFVRVYFENLQLFEIVKMIDNQLDKPS